MTARIVRGKLKDLDTLVPLFDRYRQFYGKTSDPGAVRHFLRKRLLKKDSVIFLATSPDKQGIGFVQLYPSFSSVSMKRLWILNDLFVRSDGRRRGVAQKLIGESVAMARRSGAKGLILETARTNSGARRLYRKLGWKVVKDFLTYEFTFEKSYE